MSAMDTQRKGFSLILRSSEFPEKAVPGLRF